MNLLIDVGNSRLKWAFAAGNRWAPGGSESHAQSIPALLNRIWGGQPRPRQVLMASVATSAASDAIIDWIERAWSLAPYRVVAQPAFLGIKNGYEEPERLGSDRWAALIGARALSDDPVCIADCGTAVTIDALTGDGRFLGGVILPGLALARTCLVEGTAGVRITEGTAESALARNTADGVAAGVLYGLAGAVDRIATEQAQVLGPQMQLLLTGGDAAVVADKLQRSARVVPDLVLRGLARIAETL